MAMPANCILLRRDGDEAMMSTTVTPSSVRTFFSVSSIYLLTISYFINFILIIKW